MNRTVISLPPALHERVKRLAEEQGISMAEFIRTALQEKVDTCRPKPRFGSFDSGHTDTAARAGEIKYEPPSWR